MTTYPPDSDDITDDSFGMTYQAGYWIFHFLIVLWCGANLAGLYWWCTRQTWLFGWAIPRGKDNEYRSCSATLVLIWQSLLFLGSATSVVAFVSAPYWNHYDVERVSLPGEKLAQLGALALLVSFYWAFLVAQIWCLVFGHCGGLERRPLLKSYTRELGFHLSSTWLVVPGLALLALYCDYGSAFSNLQDSHYYGVMTVLNYTVVEERTDTGRQGPCNPDDEPSTRGCSQPIVDLSYSAEPIVGFGKEWACPRHPWEHWCTAQLEFPFCKSMETYQEAEECLRQNYHMDYYDALDPTTKTTGARDRLSPPSSNDWPTEVLYGNCDTCEVVQASHLKDALGVAQTSKRTGSLLVLSGLLVYAALIALYFGRKERAGRRRRTFLQPPDEENEEEHDGGPTTVVHDTDPSSSDLLPPIEEAEMGAAQIVQVSVQKPNRETKVGLATKLNNGVLVITGIPKGGLLAQQQTSNRLQVGMEVLQINGVDVRCLEARRAMAIIQSCQGTVTIRAREP